MDKPKPMPVQLDPASALSLTAAQLKYDEEMFYLLLFSGSALRQYTLSPKHAKRLMLLLKQEVSKYEEVFGVLDTKLPETAQSKTQGQGQELGFSNPPKE